MKIYLIAAPSLTGGMQEFLASRHESWQRENEASDSELLVEAAGRICYMSFGERQFRKRNGDYIANIVAQGHESVLEHANFTLLADGLSRALSHQIVRHRPGFAYSQLSQQYHDDSNADLVEPAGLSDHPEAQRQWRVATAASRDAYRSLLAEANALGDGILNTKEKKRLLRSVARSVLPNATATSLMVTGNARAWRHVLAVRGAITGDLEMRSYCVEVLRVLSAAAPVLFFDFQIFEDNLGELVRHCDSRGHKCSV
ncbi:FAD-dependent thymidylate synthase [Acidovorax sp. NCPPB 4044]|uniref:FAD-dependent thymidylate synthase n=1 Tax=Acidovorax sp. NCPPB 4044 TaxID=2940490 RepID=UPI002303AE79|nr:FAD-dependent thymidylate synthase [Acidovorax sp. NCPPB 4044]MDA8520126.1 FAD-dependent thymidylate synthase [Acidovorax sp. NCPPB 4044]